MIKFLLPLLCITLCAPAFAGTLKISVPSFEEAVKAPSYFKFIGRSKKLGLFGSSFEGYAKEATLSFERNGHLLENLKLSISTPSLDTDNGARNEKMLGKCLAATEYPEIKINSLEAVDENKEAQELNAEMLVRGARVPLRLKLTKEATGAFTGESEFRLSDAKIPDPSIAIASVKDEFKIEFRVLLGSAE